MYADWLVVLLMLSALDLQTTAAEVIVPTTNRTTQATGRNLLADI